MGDVGFTQLGRRVSAHERRETARRALLSVLVIGDDPAAFTVASLDAARLVLEALGGLGEILYVDGGRPGRAGSSGHERGANLLADVPDARVLLPTEPLSRPRALALGLREALAPLVLAIDTSCALEALDLDSLFRGFRDQRLFALGPRLVDAEGEPLPSVSTASADSGRFHLVEGTRDAAAASLALRGFLGVYDRAKCLFLGEPDPAFGGPWAAVDWFWGAWSRGWATTVDPACCLRLGAVPAGLAAGRSFAARVAWGRQEIRFLKKRLAGWKLAPGGAGRLAGWWPGRRPRPAEGAVLAPQDVFALLAGKET